ncbi:MAG: hypothetical protein IKU25_04370 [Clostridia bacterium]|nr:hypothetical protein [Clostridia bacterium]
MDYFLLNIIFLIFGLIYYLYFRAGISSYCKVSKISKSFVRKNKKGMANYWLYKQLHQQRNLGSFYYINYLFLITLAVFLFATTLSWISRLRIPSIIIAIILGIIEIIATFKSLIYHNLERFDQPFVLFRIRRGPNGRSRHTNSILDWVIGFVPLGVYLFLLTRI